MQVRAILKAVTELAGGEAEATVQLVGLGNVETFHDGYAVSHAISRSLLTPGADIVVDISDTHHPGDGHVVSVAAVSSGGGGSPLEQFGAALVPTDGSGNGSIAITFPNTFGTFTVAPDVELSAAQPSLGIGSLQVAAVTTVGFTLNVAGVAVTNGAIPVAWDAQ